MTSNKCASCQKTVFLAEETRAADALWHKMWYVINTNHVPVYCVLCTVTVHCYCVLLLCTVTVHYYCVLCTVTVYCYYYCVLFLCNCSAEITLSTSGLLLLFVTTKRKLFAFSKSILYCF